MDSKNNARSSCRRISLCKHFKVSFSLYILTALDILQGGPLVRGWGGGVGVGWAKTSGHGDRERCAERGEGAVPGTGLELLA